VCARRHLPPPENRQPVGAEHGLDFFYAGGSARLIRRQKEHRNPVVAARRKVDAAALHSGAKEGIREREQEAGPVAGFPVAPAGPAVLEVFEEMKAVIDNVVGRPGAAVSDESDTTGVALIERCVQR
jgi:hypothetical protein